MTFENVNLNGLTIRYCESFKEILTGTLENNKTIPQVYTFQLFSTHAIFWKGSMFTNLKCSEKFDEA